MTQWRPGRALVGVAGGLAIDRMVGDRPQRWHPVSWFGNLMAARERAAWRDDRTAGALHTLAGVAVGAGAGAAITTATSRVLPGVRAGKAQAAATAVALGAVLGARGLDRSASGIHATLAAGDLDGARRQLPALVRRDPTDLAEAGIARAVIEAVAEGTVDAVVAPALWAAVGGPIGACAYRAVDTLDAMVGHRTERYSNFGWASARLDDAANYVPARAAAILVAATRPHHARAVWRAVMDDAPSHPSPNAGVIEAAFAAALGVRLGGSNVYEHHVEDQGHLGTGRPPRGEDIAAARRLARDVDLALLGALGAVALATAAVRRRPGGPVPAG